MLYIYDAKLLNSAEYLQKILNKICRYFLLFLLFV